MQINPFHLYEIDLVFQPIIGNIKNRLYNNCEDLFCLFIKIILSLEVI